MGSTREQRRGDVALPDFNLAIEILVWDRDKHVTDYVGELPYFNLAIEILVWDRMRVLLSDLRTFVISISQSRFLCGIVIDLVAVDRQSVFISISQSRFLCGIGDYGATSVPVTHHFNLAIEILVWDRPVRRFRVGVCRRYFNLAIEILVWDRAGSLRSVMIRV